jgi:hypothetical protein
LLDAHASVHRSFIMIGDASRGPKWLCESVAAIRVKNRFWRVPMRREAGEHENFFIAKNRDSESAQRAFDRYPRAATASRAGHPSDAMIAKTPMAQVFPSILTIAGAAFSHTIRIVARMRCCVVDQRSSRALTPARQHFLKQDTVFSNVLVYSGCSASRFPSARSD